MSGAMKMFSRYSHFFWHSSHSSSVSLNRRSDWLILSTSPRTPVPQAQFRSLPVGGWGGRGGTGPGGREERGEGERGGAEGRKTGPAGDKEPQKGQGAARQQRLEQPESCSRCLLRHALSQSKLSLLQTPHVRLAMQEADISAQT